MYIEINNTHYPCKCRPGKTMTYSELPDDFPTPVLDEIALCADDGFVLRTDNPLDYLRQRFENGVLILTNEPEQPPEPEEPQERQPTLDERVTAVEEAVEILLNGETEPPEEETEPEEEVSDGQS